MYDPADPPRDFGVVKVGITDGDVVDRIGQLQTGNPWELRCVDAFKTSCAREVEHFVHRTHAAKMQQLEWLRWPRDTLQVLIEEAKEAARRIEEMSGAFHWRNVPRPSNFTAEKLAAEDAIVAAEASARDFLEKNIALEGWTPRTAEVEQYHDEFLRMTGDVSRLEGDLADLESELTVRMGEHDALVHVCSYKRRLRIKIDAAVFCEAYPDEAARCVEPVAEQLRKYVYPTRAYW